MANEVKKFGIVRIDADHRNMVDGIKEAIKFGYDIRSKSSLAVVKEIFEDHCTVEEHTMKRVKYPYYNLHVLSHTLAYNLLISALENPNAIVLDLLLNDVIEHINNFDARLFEEIEDLGPFS